MPISISPSAGAPITRSGPHLTYTVYDIFQDFFSFLIENICFNKQYQEAIYSQHHAIYDAIRRRSGDEARKRIMEHLTFVDGELRKRTSCPQGIAAPAHR